MVRSLFRIGSLEIPLNLFKVYFVMKGILMQFSDDFHIPFKILDQFRQNTLTPTIMFRSSPWGPFEYFVVFLHKSDRTVGFFFSIFILR